MRLRREAVAWREVDGEVVALDLARSEYLAVNPSGALLWRALEQGATAGELAEALCERFGIPPSRADSDVAVFLAEARERGLLEGA